MDIELLNKLVKDSFIELNTNQDIKLFEINGNAIFRTIDDKKKLTPIVLFYVYTDKCKFAAEINVDLVGYDESVIKLIVKTAIDGLVSGIAAL